MSKAYFVELAVRDYELDPYGVVNNSVYFNYLEHARHDFLNSVGIDPAQVAREGRALTLAEIRVRFRRPLRSRERFRVSVTVEELRGARAVMGQRIVRLPEETLVLEATAVAVFLDDAGRPMRISPKIRRAFAPYLQHEKANA